MTAATISTSSTLLLVSAILWMALGSASCTPTSSSFSSACITPSRVSIDSGLSLTAVSTGEYFDSSEDLGWPDSNGLSLLLIAAPITFVAVQFVSVIAFLSFPRKCCTSTVHDASRGVFPSASFVSRLAPSDIRYSTMSWFPLLNATCSAVKWASLYSFTFTPHTPTKYSATSKNPVEAHSWSAVTPS